MIKLIAILILFMSTSLVCADRTVMGYYQDYGPYNDYIIIYTYTRSDGSIGLSHCRTSSNANFQYAFLQQASLDINNCDLSYTPTQTEGTPAETPLGNPQTTSTFSTQKAF